MVLLDGNQEYLMQFENHDHVSNISYHGDIDDFEANEWLGIRHDFPEKVDHAQVGPTAGEKAGNHQDVWPVDPLQLTSYDYHTEREKAPYSVRYIFNARNKTTKTPARDDTGALSLGNDFSIKPVFYKCFYDDCIVPDIATLLEPPELVTCYFIDCFDGLIPGEYSDITVPVDQHVIIDKTFLSEVKGHIKFGTVFLDGTLEVPADAFLPDDHVTIEVDNIIISNGAGNGNGERQRRATVNYRNGALIIGSKKNPIPCDVKLTVKLNGYQNHKSFGAFPGSIPIGSKAIGGPGAVQMHGCQIEKVFTTLRNTVESGTILKLNGNVQDNGWRIGDRIAVTSTDYEHRHTEYFTITKFSLSNPVGNQDITVDRDIKWRHLGSQETTQDALGKTFDQSAEVVLFRVLKYTCLNTI